MKDTCAKISRDQSPVERLPGVYVGTKHGSLMVTDLPNKVASLAAALARLSARWDKAIGRARTKTGYKLNRTHDEIELDLHTCMPASDRQKLGEWFTARYQYLDEEYRRAINASENIIGKQWLYDRRPKLAPEEPLPRSSGLHDAWINSGGYGAQPEKVRFCSGHPAHDSEGPDHAVV